MAPPTPEQVTALRDAYGGRARQATREADDLEKAAEARRTAEWQDEVDLDATLQERAFAEKRAAQGRRAETTQLGAEEPAFQQWAKRNNVRDVDHPDSFYDYRGFYRETRGAPMRGGVDHFPDTYKQHGHPTFSQESAYSAGPDDGGTWNGETFVPPEPPWSQVVNPYVAKAAALREARGLPPIGDPMVLRGTGLPQMAAPVAVAPEAVTPMGALGPEQPMDVSRSPLVQGFRAVANALPSGPIGGGGGVLDPAREVPPVGPPTASPAPVVAAPTAATGPTIDQTIAAANAAIAESRAARGAPPEVRPAPPGAPRAIFSGAAAPSAGPAEKTPYDLAKEAEQANLALQLQQRQGGGPGRPATPEYEQRTQVHRERSQGYDPALLDEQAALEVNPRALTEAAAVPQQAPRAAYDPKLLAEMIAPPPEARTPKERDAYFSGLAKQAAESGQSLSTLLASGSVRLAAPLPNTKPVDDTEARVYSDAHKAAFAAAVEPFQQTGVDLQDPANARLVQQADLEAKAAGVEAVNRARILGRAEGVDAQNLEARQRFEHAEGMRLERVAARTATDVERFGERGQLGFEQEKLRLEAQGHEATAEAEREMAKAAGDAIAAGDELRKKADAEKPGVMQSILGVIGAGLGAFGQGMVGGPNQYIEAAKHKIATQAASLTEDAAVQKGIEISRLEQIRHNLQAKLAMGMGEAAMNAAKQMDGKLALAILEKRKQLSEATRGTEKTASAVIPAKAAVAGGPGGPLSLKEQEKILGRIKGNEKEAIELGLKGAEAGAKRHEGPRTITIDGKDYLTRPGISQHVVDEGQKQALYLANGAEAAKTLKQRLETPGGWIPNDPEVRVLVQELAGPISQTGGSGVPSESDKKDIAEATGIGPRQKAAVGRLVRTMELRQKNLIRHLAKEEISRK